MSRYRQWIAATYEYDRQGLTAPDLDDLPAGDLMTEIEERGADERRRWEEDPATRPCPGGESGNDVAGRVRAFLGQLLHDHVASHGSADATEWPVLAVAHSSLNRILMCVALDLPVREFRQRFSQGQVNLTVLRFEHGDGPGDARLVLANDLAHVRPPGATPWE